MIHATPDTAQAHNMHGVVFRSHIRSELGSSQLAAWQADFPPHTPGQVHRMSVEEVFRMLTGTLVIDIEGERAELSSGDVVAVPAGVSFCVTNDGDDPATAWVVTPVGMTVTMEGASTSMAPPWAQ